MPNKSRRKREEEEEEEKEERSTPAIVAVERRRKRVVGKNDKKCRYPYPRETKVSIQGTSGSDDDDESKRMSAWTIEHS